MAGTPNATVHLNQTSPIDVLSGNAVCSNTTVEFTCIASGVDTIGWQINSGRRETWHATSSSRISYLDQNKIYFDSILWIGSSSNGAGIFNITSRFVGTIDHGLHSEDNITCLGLGTGTTTPEMESQTLHYSTVTGEILMLL